MKKFLFLLLGIPIAFALTPRDATHERQDKYYRQNGKYLQEENVDVYESPQGHGYTITETEFRQAKTATGKTIQLTCTRVTNVGPESNRQHNWLCS